MKKFLCALLIFAMPLISRGEEGVSADSIKVGCSYPLTSANSVDTKHRQNAQRALIKRVNSEGGIHGRKIALIETDDKFDPKLAAENTLTMLNRDHVFAIINYESTPIVRAVMPIAERMNVPFFGGATGDPGVTSPPKKQIFVVKPTFYDEAKALVDYFVDTAKVPEIGIFYQDDALGLSGRGAVVQSMQARMLKPVAFAAQKRGDMDFALALAELTKANAKVVLLYAISPVTVAFVKFAKSKGFNPVYVMPSLVSSHVIEVEFKKEAENMIFAKAYPDEANQSLPIVKEFRATMAAAGHGEGEMVAHAFEMYFNTAIFIEGLKRAGKDLTRDKFMAALETMENVDMGGVKVSFSPTRHKALDKIYLFKIKDGAHITLN